MQAGRDTAAYTAFGTKPWALGGSVMHSGRPGRKHDSLAAMKNSPALSGLKNLGRWSRIQVRFLRKIRAAPEVQRQ